MTGANSELTAELPVVSADPGDGAELRRIAGHLDRGGLLAHPTETVYGLGASADEAGVEALRRLKGRDDGKPFLLLVRDETVPLDWPPVARTLAGAFWPGPLTLVLFDRTGHFPDEVRNRQGGVAVRVSPHPFVRALLGTWNGSLLSTSANAPGEAPARSAGEVAAWARSRPGAGTLWIADGGILGPSKPSTIVDCTTERPVVLRVGALPEERIRDVVGDQGWRTG